MTVTMMLNPARMTENPISPNAIAYESAPTVDWIDSGAYPVQPNGNPPSMRPDSRIRNATGVSQNDSASSRGKATRLDPIISGTR